MVSSRGTRGGPGAGTEQRQRGGPGRLPPGTFQKQEGGEHTRRGTATVGGTRRGASEMIGAPPVRRREPLEGGALTLGAVGARGEFRGDRATV